MSGTSRAHTFWIAGVVLTLTWGAAAFGGNYPWAYAPLLVSSVVLGTAGLLMNRQAAVPWPVAACLITVAAAVGAQLVPVSLSTLDQLSPATTRLLSQQDLAVAAGVASNAPLSIDPARTRLGLFFLGSFSLLLLGTTRTLTREDARTLAIGVVMLGVLLAMAGIIQRATFNGKIYGFWVPVYGGSPFGPFVNRNHFAGWMLMGLPLAIGVFSSGVSRGMRGVKPHFRDRVLWLSSSDASKTLLLAFAVVTMALALVLTTSRSGMMGLAGALCLSAVLMARRQMTTGRRVVVSGYLVFVAVLVVFWVGFDQIAARFTGSDVVDMSGRWAIWADTVRIARDFWLTGTGLNTYGVSTLYYQTALPGQHLREAHSEYLQLAAEGGLLLGVPIVSTVAVFVWQVRRRLQKDVGSIWWTRMGAVTGLLAIAVQSLGEFSLQMPGNAALFSVLCGIALHDSQKGVTANPRVLR